MEQHDVERIIGGVLSDLAAPFRLLDVERTPTGWHAMLKQTTGGRVISVRVPDGPPTANRTTVLQSIEAETESRHSRGVSPSADSVALFVRTCANGPQHTTRSPELLMACPRCGHLQPKHLGPARSTINWFACPACQFVWSDRPATADVDVAPPSGAGRKHILVVDDDPKVSRIVARWLSDYRVSIARDGYEALAIIRSERVDLLIVDYVMPSMTGQELVEMCKAEGRIFSVLLLTGYADILEREDSSWWASRPHLTKPVDVDELRAAVARLIGWASSPHTPHP